MRIFNTPEEAVADAPLTKPKEICPECGVNRWELRKMLKEPDVVEKIEATTEYGCVIKRLVTFKSPNRTIAEHIISGCKSCTKSLRKEVENRGRVKRQ